MLSTDLFPQMATDWISQMVTVYIQATRLPTQSRLTSKEHTETQVWLNFALGFGYIDEETHARLDGSCNSVIGMLVTMSNQPEKWL